MIKKIFFTMSAVCLIFFLSGCLGLSAVKGKIVRDTGEPLAEKEIILIPVLEGEKVKVLKNYGGVTEAPLNSLNLGIGGKILFETAGGKPRWKTKTDGNGNFVIADVPSGRYVLLRMVAGSVIIMGTKNGFIIFDVTEQGTRDLGTITLLPSGESIPK